jgi:hypothetical protein
VLKYFSYPLLKSKNASFINIDVVITSLVRRTYGDHILVKFDNNKYSNILRADVVAFDNDVNGSLGVLLYNEFITNGYPSTLQLSHHVSTFSNTDLSGIQGFIKSNYFIKEIFHENVRNSILGSVWK